MKKRIVNGFFKSLFLFGAILMIGSVGSSELALITLKEYAIRCTIGLILSFIGFAGLRKRGVL